MSEQDDEAARLAADIAALEHSAEPDLSPGEAAALVAGADTPPEKSPEQVRAEAKAQYMPLVTAVLTPSAQIICPAWELSGDEISALADSYAECLATYWPEMGDMPAWVAPLITTAVIVGPRLGKPRRKQSQAGELRPTITAQEGQAPAHERGSPPRPSAERIE